MHNTFQAKVDPNLYMPETCFISNMIKRVDFGGFRTNSRIFELHVGWLDCISGMSDSIGLG